MKIGLRHLIAALLLGVLVYALSVFYSGYHHIRESFRTFGWGALWLALGLSSANYALRYAKWQFYLARLGVLGVRWHHSALIFLSGFVLTVTPGKLGEVFKSAVLFRTHGIAVERTAPIVVAERLTDVIAIVFLVALGSVGFPGGLWWAAAGSAVVLVALVAVASPTLLPRGVERVSRSRRFGYLAPKLERAVASLREVTSPRALGIPVLLSIVGWGLEGVGLFVLLRGFGQEVSLSFAMFFYATSTLAGALVPVPGGLGVTEAMLFEQLVLLAGVDKPIATASMLLIRLATLWWAVLVGFAALGVLRVAFPRLSAPRLVKGEG